MSRQAGEIKDGETIEEEETETIQEEDTTNENEPEADEEEEQQEQGGEEEQQQKETWMLTGEEEEQETDNVPVARHISVRNKLKGRISEKDDEIDRLKQEIEQIKSGRGQAGQPGQPEQMKRPDPLDFTTDAEYHAAMDKYEESLLEQRYNRLEAKRTYDLKVQEVNAAREKAVNTHYDRAAKLINDSAIDPDVYRESDITVRQAVENMMPKRGDLVVDQMISLLGEGSEKVMYYLGRNRNALNEFKVLLSEDQSGLKAAVYLGEQKTRLLAPAKRQSQAPKPGRKIEGDSGVTNQVDVSEMKKKYDKYHKNGNIQQAYDIKRKAKLAGVNTGKW